MNHRRTVPGTTVVQFPGYCSGGLDLSDGNDFASRFKRKTEKVDKSFQRQQEEEAARKAEEERQRKQIEDANRKALSESVRLGHALFRDTIKPALEIIQTEFPGGVLRGPDDEEHIRGGEKTVILSMSYKFSGENDASIALFLHCAASEVRLTVIMDPGKTGHASQPFPCMMATGEFLQDRSKMVEHIERVLVDEIDGFQRTVRSNYGAS
ncbi:hypothetical protein ACYFX5_08935 [Bremerella sp. T1]|uniref:hypothetical protein n=1 Tax=Bremerella sp. TYQ1 TaxID=3119568 RepID=UPI001CCEC168|nr:hypothetical protein [Bremerella volcania]UBM38379.1 hypothetical protein LA756_10865 [Bremerella volcania]